MVMMLVVIAAAFPLTAVTTARAESRPAPILFQNGSFEDETAGVPANWTLRLISGSLSVGGTTGSQVATIGFYSTVNGVRYLTSKIGSANGFQFFSYNPALDVPEKTDIVASGTMSSGTALVTSTFNGFLVKNTL
jgi:hypothetical protein